MCSGSAPTSLLFFIKIYKRFPKIIKEKYFWICFQFWPSIEASFMQKNYCNDAILKFIWMAWINYGIYQWQPWPYCHIGHIMECLFIIIPSLYIDHLTLTIYLSYYRRCIFVSLASLYIYHLSLTVYLSSYPHRIIIILHSQYIYHLTQTVYSLSYPHCIFIILPSLCIYHLTMN